MSERRWVVAVCVVAGLSAFGARAEGEAGTGRGAPARARDAPAPMTLR